MFPRCEILCFYGPRHIRTEKDPWDLASGQPVVIQQRAISVKECEIRS